MIKYHKISKAAKDLVRGSEGAAGFDICSNDGPFFIPPQQRVLLGTGISLEFTDNIVCDIRPRSGLAYGLGIDVLAGTIDSDYKGEVKVLLINHGEDEAVIERGDRIAQLVFRPVITDVVLGDGNISETERGDKGFGSTGK